MIKKFLSLSRFVCVGSRPSVLVCVPPRRCRAPKKVRARWPRLRGSVAPGLGFVLRRVPSPRCPLLGAPGSMVRDAAEMLPS